MKGRGLHRIVVLSDLHLGEKGSMLSGADVVRRLIGELRELGHIDRLILLGDIWDLWRTSLAAAAEEGRAFFDALSSWDGPDEVDLVVGNHDFHLESFYQERRTRWELGWSEAEEGSMVIKGRAGPRKTVCCSGDLCLRQAYPFLHLEVQEKSVLLLHGHHLDFFSGSFWWAKSSWLSRWILGLTSGIAIGDIDRLNKPFFELLTVTAHVPELVSREYRFYRLLRSAARLLRFQSKSGASLRRYTSLEQNTRAAGEVLTRLLPGYIPDVLVFGHTHKAGLGRLDLGGRTVFLANCGCWLEDTGDEDAGIYLVVDDRLRICRLGEGEVTGIPLGSPHTFVEG
ncbi:MAG: metallophosphoesterase [Actinomycetota bacterium]|nr:metallophosphoesterase [Actinomycetota bacterium]